MIYMDILMAMIGIVQILIAFHLSNMLREDMKGRKTIIIYCMIGLVLFLLIIGMYLISVSMFI